MHLAAPHVQGQLRPGHVGDDQVEQPRREVQPRGLREDRRRREALHTGQHLGANRLLGLLQAVHRRLDRAQPRDRVADVDRQRPAHHGDAVAEVALLVLGPRRHRDQRAQLQPLGAHAARVQPVAQRAADDGQDHVVDGAAERVLDLLEVLEPVAHDAVAAMRADLDVQRRRRRRVQPGPGDLAEALGGLAERAQRRLRVAHDAQRAGRGARRGAAPARSRRRRPARRPSARAGAARARRSAGPPAGPG